MLYSRYSDKKIYILTSMWFADGGEGRQIDSFSSLTINDPYMTFDSQLDCLMLNLKEVTDSEGRPVFIRFFLSDPANQAETLRSRMQFDCPVSVIGQAPLNGTKIAALVWCRPKATVTCIGDKMHKVSERGIDEYWYTCGVSDAEGSYSQTVSLLDHLGSKLSDNGLSLEDNCLRTWLFVQNIDVNYKGVVDGRNTVFDRHGLTRDTHFIASTGIEGRTENHANKVMLDAVAVSGEGVNVRYLHGLSHLNRTSEYGVRFERGSLVELPDRRYVFISGTASIDNKGKILFEGDIEKQTGRMIENVKVLLSEAGCGFDNLGSVIVYLRDPADYAVVKRIIEKRFPECPYVIVQAPVCRPGWLVEMECIAIF